MLVEYLEQSYRAKAEADNQKPRRWNRASSIGRCPRELAQIKLYGEFVKRGDDWNAQSFRGDPLTPRRMSIFDDGHFYDEKLKNDLVKAYPWAVPIPIGSWPSVWIEDVEITGTPDFLIMPNEYPTVGLGEIKSMSNFAFERAIDGRIDEPYCCQAWVYAQRNDLNPIVFVCVRKETRHICEVIFDREAKETIITKRYGGNELEIAANDPMLIAEVRSPFDASVENRVRQTIQQVASCSDVSKLPSGIRSIRPETIKVQGKAKAEEFKAQYGEPVQGGSWYTFETKRMILDYPCSYCSYIKNCFPTASLEIESGKPKWVTP